jgi:hypothetical protein
LYEKKSELNNVVFLKSVTPLCHINMTPNQPVFNLTPKYYLLSREAADTNFTVFGLTLTGK